MTSCLHAFVSSNNIITNTFIVLDNNVDGNMLLELTNNELKHELGIESLGHRKKLLEVNRKCGYCVTSLCVDMLNVVNYF